MHYSTLRLALGPPRAVRESRNQHYFNALRWIVSRYPEMAFRLTLNTVPYVIALEDGEYDHLDERHDVRLTGRANSSVEPIMEHMDKIQLAPTGEGRERYFYPTKKQIRILLKASSGLRKRHYNDYFTVYGNIRDGWQIIYDFDEACELDIYQHLGFYIATPGKLPKPCRSKILDPDEQGGIEVMSAEGLRLALDNNGEWVRVQ